MGFTDFVSDSGLIRTFRPTASKDRQLTSILVLNNWLKTRSYIAGYVYLPEALPHIPLSRMRTFWSVLMRRLKTPQNDYFQPQAIAPLIYHEKRTPLTQTSNPQNQSLIPPSQIPTIASRRCQLQGL